MMDDSLNIMSGKHLGYVNTIWVIDVVGLRWDQVPIAVIFFYGPDDSEVIVNQMGKGTHFEAYLLKSYLFC